MNGQLAVRSPFPARITNGLLVGLYSMERIAKISVLPAASVSKMLEAVLVCRREATLRITLHQYLASQLQTPQ